MFRYAWYVCVSVYVGCVAAGFYGDLLCSPLSSTGCHASAVLIYESDSAVAGCSTGLDIHADKGDSLRFGPD